MPYFWFVHVPWMSFLIPLCYRLFSSHEEHIIRPASDSVSISTDSWLAMHASRISCLIIQSMWLHSAAPSKKSQEGQPTDCQEVWTMRQERESMWLVSEYGPSVSSQNWIGLSYLMTCICKNICLFSKGGRTPYTVNGTMHPSIWKSKMCLVAQSYEMTYLPQCIVDGQSGPNKAVRKIKVARDKLFASKQAHYFSAAKYVNTGTG